MIIQRGANMNTAGLARAYQPQSFTTAPSPSAGASVQAQKEDAARRFDSVTISENGANYAMEAKSRISQEVRTATSTDMISTLRDQIRNGAYQPDPTAIARKMLLMEEAV